VSRQERRQDEAQSVLGGLPRRHTKRPPPIEQPQREQAVDRDRPVERQGADPAAPEPEEPEPPGLHRVERDEAERVVGEVQDQVGEEDERRAEAQAPNEPLRHRTLFSPSGRALATRSAKGVQPPRGMASAELGAFTWPILVRA
jgi:hypothetical protein